MEEGYKGLKVYAKSYELALRVYKASEGLPRKEEYGLTSQMKRAATSIPLNIAEGHGKQESKAEFRRFVIMAKGSCNEMQVLLELSKDLGYMDAKEYQELSEGYAELGKMLGGFRKYLETTD